MTQNISHIQTLDREPSSVDDRPEMAEGRQTVTMRDVANLAGVSTMTVSRVLNDATLVRPSTRNKVEQAIQHLNYTPNLGARRLAGGRSLFIGLVYHNPSPGFLGSVVTGALKACRAGGHHLVLQDLEDIDPQTHPEEAVRSLNMADLNGLVIAPPLSNYAPFLAAMEETKIPLIQVASGEIEGGLWTGMDDRAAMKEMATKVVEAGHERIGFIRGASDHSSAKNRFSGFQDGLRAKGLSLHNDLIRTGDYTFASGVAAGRSLLEGQAPPSAIVASNDDMAAGVIAAARQIGYDLPEDLSVTGFDNTTMATSVWPTLTTVHQPIQAMTKTAVELLSAHIHGDRQTLAGVQRLLNYEIILRGSLAPPRR